MYISNVCVLHGPQHFNAIVQLIFFPHFLQEELLGSITTYIQKIDLRKRGNVNLYYKWSIAVPMMKYTFGNRLQISGITSTTKSTPLRYTNRLKITTLMPTSIHKYSKQMLILNNKYIYIYIYIYITTSTYKFTHWTPKATDTNAILSIFISKKKKKKHVRSRIGGADDGLGVNFVVSTALGMVLTISGSTWARNTRFSRDVWLTQMMWSTVHWDTEAGKT